MFLQSRAVDSDFVTLPSTSTRHFVHYSHIFNKLAHSLPDLGTIYSAPNPPAGLLPAVAKSMYFFSGLGKYQVGQTPSGGTGVHPDTPT
jgi:hypothetical protein